MAKGFVPLKQDGGGRKRRSADFNKLPAATANFSSPCFIVDADFSAVNAAKHKPPSVQGTFTKAGRLLTPTQPRRLGLNNTFGSLL